MTEPVYLQTHSSYGSLHKIKSIKPQHEAPTLGKELWEVDSHRGKESHFSSGTWKATHAPVDGLTHMHIQED